MKFKLFIQIIMIGFLGLGSISYGNHVFCAALRVSQAYEKGDITENRLQELYHLWKNGLNKYFRASYDTEDPIATYEDFKIIFALGKKRIQLNCPIDNEAGCYEQLKQLEESLHKEIKVAKRILNTEDKLIEFLLDETEDLFTGVVLGTLWAYLHYFRCDDDLDDIISELSLELLGSQRNEVLKQKDL